MSNEKRAKEWLNRTGLTEVLSDLARLLGPQLSPEDGARMQPERWIMSLSSEFGAAERGAREARDREWAAALAPDCKPPQLDPEVHAEAHRFSLQAARDAALEEAAEACDDGTETGEFFAKLVRALKGGSHD